MAGNEIAHVLEGSPELYNAMADTILELARTKGEYDSRMAQITKLYEGRDGYTGEDANTKIQKELVADLVGDYLFSDENFVKKLSAENRNLFQTLWDEVKYLCRVVTAGSKEARQLEAVKKRFEAVYRAEMKNTVVEDGVRYALASVEDVTPSAEQKEQNIRKVAEMESVYTVDASKLIPGEKSIKEIYRDFFTAWGENIHSDVFGDIAVKNSSIRSEMRHGSTPVKVASIEAIPSVIQNGKIVEWIEKDSGLFRIVVAAPIKIGNTPYYMGVMLQRDAQNQRLYLHDVVIEKEASELSQEHLDSTGPYEENENLYTTSILEKIVEVKSKTKRHQDSLSERGRAEDIAPMPESREDQDAQSREGTDPGETWVARRKEILERRLRNNEETNKAIVQRLKDEIAQLQKEFDSLGNKATKRAAELWEQIGDRMQHLRGYNTLAKEQATAIKKELARLEQNTVVVHPMQEGHGGTCEYRSCGGGHHTAGRLSEKQISLRKEADQAAVSNGATAQEFGG